jgi:cytosine/adenosine deaminase-related metal-dependent hydrolase
LAAKQKLQDLNSPIIFSHGGFCSGDDVRALRATDSFLAITPENEMSEGHGQVTSYLVHDHAALGTDTNWNISGDLLLQARLWLQSVRKASYQKTLNRGLAPRTNPMSVNDAFLLLTRQGGRALGRNDIGVLKVGAKADIVCFNGDSPNMIGWTNAVAAVVCHANVGDIEHVLTGGRFRKRNGVLVLKTKKWADVAAEFKKTAKKIQSQNSEPPPLPPKFMGLVDLGDVEMATVG